MNALTRPSIARFDGAATWPTLKAEQQAAIGAAALELVACWHGIDAVEAALEDPETSAFHRAFSAADTLLHDRLQIAVDTALPDLSAAEPPPVPAMLGPVCRNCCCSEEAACEPACSWVEPDLCSACAEAGR